MVDNDNLVYLREKSKELFGQVSWAHGNESRRLRQIAEELEELRKLKGPIKYVYVLMEQKEGLRCSRLHPTGMAFLDEDDAKEWAAVCATRSYCKVRVYEHIGVKSRR